MKTTKTISMAALLGEAFILAVLKNGVVPKNPNLHGKVNPLKLVKRSVSVLLLEAISKLNFVARD